MTARLPPNEAWRALRYAPVQPWFAQRLERAGVPIQRTLVKEEVRYPISETQVGWIGHEIGGICEVDDEPREGAPEHVEPALHDYQVPEVLAVLAPHDVVAEWAARTFTPSALETLRALTHHGETPAARSPRGTWVGQQMFEDRDNAFKENLVKMHEDSLRSDAPEPTNAWEKDM